MAARKLGDFHRIRKPLSGEPQLLSLEWILGAAHHTKGDLIAQRRNDPRQVRRKTFGQATLNVRFR